MVLLQEQRSPWAARLVPRPRCLWSLPSAPRYSLESSLPASLGLGGSYLPPQPLSARLSDVSHEVAKNFLSGGAGAQWGFADVSATDVGDETPESRRACSPHALGPAAFKVPAAPAFPPSLGPGKGTTATISSSPHALLWKPRRPVSEVSFYCLSVASSGTAAAPAPGVERGTEERAEGPLRHGLRDYWR